MIFSFSLPRFVLGASLNIAPNEDLYLSYRIRYNVCSWVNDLCEEILAVAKLAPIMFDTLTILGSEVRRSV